jgi:Tfp pilus assembly protein PilF
MASQTGDRYQQARAHNGLARTWRATGDHDQARHHWERALTLYTTLGAPQARQTKACLSALQQSCKLHTETPWPA